MRKLIIILLALVVVACSAPPAPTQQPVAAPPEPTQTAVVVVITATSAPTEAVAPTDLPTYTPLPTYTVPPPPPTEAPAQQPAATQEVAAPPTEAPAAGGPIAVDDKLGGGWFVGMTRSRNDLSLRCQLNKQITFTVKVTSDDIKSVDLWYRFEDRSSGAVFEWSNFGKMVPDLAGSFTITISGDQLNPNFRKPNSYFDYQFVGYNPTGVVGRSEKIERQVTYTFDCP